MSAEQSWLVVLPTPTVTTRMDPMNAEVGWIVHRMIFIMILRCPLVNFCFCVQVVTRPVWDAWVAVPLVVRNALVATD